MSNVHSLKGQKALEAFVRASYDLENLEPEMRAILATGSVTQFKTILTQITNIERVLLKLTSHTPKATKEGSHHGA